jgi:glycosyltransferase involved in cell wall biosynthesis
MQNTTSAQATVIIPVHNGALTIVDCIESVLRNQQHISQIIVVDDASTDNTPQLVAAYRHVGVKLITNTERLGPGGARNQGLQQATGDWVFFTDADCEVQKDWVAGGLCELTRPGVVGVEGQLLYRHPNPGYRHKIPCNPFYPQQYKQMINQRDQDFAGANIAFNLQEILQLGGFDAGAFREGREDSDLGWRLKKRGQISFAPEMMVTHKDEMWNLKKLIRNARRYQDDVMFLKKHGFFFFKKRRILHPSFLSMLLFPPLIFRRYQVRNLDDLKFVPSFYLYLLVLRWNIWRGAIRFRTFVI